MGDKHWRHRSVGLHQHQHPHQHHPGCSSERSVRLRHTCGIFCPLGGHHRGERRGGGTAEDEREEDETGEDESRLNVVLAVDETVDGWDHGVWGVVCEVDAVDCLSACGADGPELM